MTTISLSYPASIPQKASSPSYILLRDDVLATLPEDYQAQIKSVEKAIVLSREYAASDRSKAVRVTGKPITNLTPEQKVQLYRPKNNGGGNFSFLKPSKVESHSADFANVKGIPANELDDRISFIANSIKKGAFKGMEFHSANGDQLTTSPKQYLQWLKEAKDSVVQFEGYA